MDQIRFLPEGSAHEIASQGAEIAMAAHTTDVSTLVAQVLTEWKHTASTYADPELYAHVAAPIEDAGPVPAPEE